MRLTDSSRVAASMTANPAIGRSELGGRRLDSPDARQQAQQHLEAQAKDLALRRLREPLGERDWRSEEDRLLAPQSLEVSSRRKPGTRPAPKSK
jgi:hypothetical protein